MGTFAGPRVRNRFDGLRHDSVICRNDENDDVGDPRTARAHQRERFMAGRVEEGDLAISCRDLIRADVLRDSAVFLFGHLAFCGWHRAGMSFRDRRVP